MGNSIIIKVCDVVKRVMKNSREGKTTIEINGFVVQGADTIVYPCLQDQTGLVNPLGTKVLKDGQNIRTVLVSKRVLEIHLGTEAPVRSKTVIKQNGDHGVKRSLNEMITLANSVSKEEVHSIQTTLNALHIIQTNALKLVMGERFAEIVIKLHPHMATTKRSYV